MDFLSERLDAMVAVIVSVEVLWNEKYEIVGAMFAGWFCGILTVVIYVTLQVS